MQSRIDSEIYDYPIEQNSPVHWVFPQNGSGIYWNLGLRPQHYCDATESFFGKVMFFIKWALFVILANKGPINIYYSTSCRN